MPSSDRLVAALTDGHGTRQNPLIFLLKAAQIYPRKLAIAHPDVPHPVFYSYEVWSVSA